MLYDIENACYQLLKLLGCDLAAIDDITTWKQFGIICIEFVFACFMLYLLWRMIAEHAHQKRYDALHDKCVALCTELQLAVHQVGLQPHTALAAVD